MAVDSKHISLRDWLAGMAMNRLVQNYSLSDAPDSSGKFSGFNTSEDAITMVAAMSYRIAEEMLEIRQEELDKPT